MSNAKEILKGIVDYLSGNDNALFFSDPDWTPQVMGVSKGQAIAIEVVVPGSVRPADRIRIQSDFARNGGLYIVARGVDDVREHEL